MCNAGLQSSCKQETSSSMDGRQAVSEEGEKPKLDGALMDDDMLLLDAKNGDASLISKTMAEEEKKLLEERTRNDGGSERDEIKPVMDRNSQLSKLDELLTQTQLYSEFLLEKMDNITFVLPLIRFISMKFLYRSFFGNTIAYLLPARVVLRTKP